MPRTTANTAELTSNRRPVNPTTVGKTSEREASKNITLMLIMTSFIFIIGTLPSRVYIIIGLVYPSAPFLGILRTTGSVSLYLFPGVKLLVFIAFNKLFRQQFMDYLKLFKL
jgi:hypothetical protein